MGWGRLTCIYLSCKVEEFHVSAEELGKGIQQDPQVVLKNELTVLQASVSVFAIVSFCCASCWALDDIMTVTFLLLLGMWQTQDADSQFVTSYMIAFPRSWAYNYILINTHCGNEIKLMGRNGSYFLPFMMKVMVWYFVNDTHKVMTLLFLSCLFCFGQEWRKVVAFKIFLWSSFCNLIDNSVSFFMFLWIAEPNLSDTKYCCNCNFHVLHH